MGGMVEIPRGHADLHRRNDRRPSGSKWLLLGTALDRTC
jgi:hypothetical protein